MSIGYTGKTTNRPRETTAVQARTERESQFGEIPGVIVSFDPTTQTAAVQPLYRPIHNGVAIVMPVLQEVPIRFQRGGDGGITFPVGAGDRVTLRPQMRSSENYHTGADYEPSDLRSMALSDMEAFIDGGEALTDPILNFDADNLHMRFDAAGQYGLRGSKEGKVKLEGNQGDIYELLTMVVELLATDGLAIQTGSSVGSNHQLEHQTQYADIAAKLRAMVLV